MQTQTEQATIRTSSTQWGGCLFPTPLESLCDESGQLMTDWTMRKARGLNRLLAHAQDCIESLRGSRREEA